MYFQGNTYSCPGGEHTTKNQLSEYADFRNGVMCSMKLIVIHIALWAKMNNCPN
jgi:hypothetical protein